MWAQVLPMWSHEGAGALVEVEVPERVGLLDLVAADFDGSEVSLGPLDAWEVGVAEALHPTPPAAAHEAADSGVGGEGAELGVLGDQGDEVVVVELVAPAAEGGVLLEEFLAEGLGERASHAVVSTDAALEDAEGVGRCAARRVVPAVDRGEAERHRVALPRREPALLGELLEAPLKLARPGRRDQQ